MAAPASPGGVPRLSARGLAVGRGKRTIVRGVELDAFAGDRVVIVGPNGCGKSTLLRALVGLDAPLAGTVTVGGQDLHALRPRRRAEMIALLPQSPGVPSGISVRELVAYGRHPHRSLLAPPNRSDRAAVQAALARTAISELADRPVDALSGGERQRAWLAMALAQSTPVLVLDEPTSYLDVRHQLDVLDLVMSLSDHEGYTIVTVLHDLDQAAWVATRLVVVDDGRVVASGPPHEVLTRQLVAEIFGIDADITTDPLTGRTRVRLELGGTGTRPSTDPPTHQPASRLSEAL